MNQRFKEFEDFFEQMSQLTSDQESYDYDGKHDDPLGYKAYSDNGGIESWY